MAERCSVSWESWLWNPGQEKLFRAIPLLLQNNNNLERRSSFSDGTNSRESAQAPPGDGTSSRENKEKGGDAHCEAPELRTSAW
ncbi:hypothetical protein chiPu_0026659 [Chiloscyllium punctatum]|uniref:Uncharacterized protein n=1 Tax=Chiloscyllium punctatum TaxID=137246 RepID=A0A401TJM5_CHIPU|nr:hypothetical protein [Chiloscyllium punctatum]